MRPARGLFEFAGYVGTLGDRFSAQVLHARSDWIAASQGIAA
ncbi:hypothetical protein [Nocardia sp. NRRL S-836]|nr:hypothetical protein [Nocardia sp. NRRL S-836]